LKTSKKAARAKKPSKKDRKPPTFEEMLRRTLKADFPTGRAPYHRTVLIQARVEVLAGFDPRKKKRDRKVQNIDQYEAAEEKNENGCLVVTEAMQRINLGQPISVESGKAGYESWRKRWLSRPKNKMRYEAAGDACESLVQEEYKQAEANRWLASCSNNHLVRHRLLILGRLVEDIIREYADGQKDRIGKIVIEVNRDLVAFSGMKKADIGSDTKGVLGSIKAQHYRVKKWLEDGLKDTKWRNAVDGRLIWKAKVADDLGCRCPYTGMEITPVCLANGTMDVDHIIPRSQRLTNAMEAVVITHRQVNAMKKELTAWQFIEKFGGTKVTGTNWELKRLEGQNGYEQFVKDLKTHGTGKAKDSEEAGNGDGDKKGIKLNPMYLPGTKKKHPDYVRRKKRKGYLMVKKFEKDKEKFTPRDLTITSFVTRLAQQALLRELPHLRPEHFVSIPGSVTGAVRDAKGWRLLGCLQAACGGNVMHEITIRDDLTGEPKQIQVVKPKGELRGITHLHHAVDACTLALLAGLIPKDGKLWELIALKEVTDAEKAQFDKLVEQYRYRGHPFADYFSVTEITNPDERQSPDPNRKWRIAPKMDERNRRRLKELKRQISDCLAEKRVVQQLPADRTGMPTDETVYRVLTSLEGNDDTVRLARNVLSEKNAELAALKQKCDAATNRVEVGLIQKRIASVEEEIKFMQDFKRNAWIVHRVRKDSPTAKGIIERQTKYRAWRDKHPLGIEIPAAGLDREGEKKQRKPRPPQAPLLLRPFDPQKHEFLILYDVVSRIGLVGTSPEFEPGAKIQAGKLQAIKGAKTIGENFGIALLPEPEIVPFHKVARRVKELNGGRPVPVLRKGQLITVPKGSNWEGDWRVLSVKNTEAYGLAVDLADRDGVDLAKGNAPVKKLRADGMMIVNTPLTGVAVEENG
jgi:hypothetical protein